MTLLSVDEILSRIRSEYTTRPERKPRMLGKAIVKLIELEGEEWKAIEGYEDYEISNKGRIVSKKYGYRKLLKTGHSKYSKIVLSKNNRKTTQLVHRLVAQHFLDVNIKDKITHIDGDTKNNSVENLSVGVAKRDEGRRGISRRLGGNESLVSNRISKGWCESCATTIKFGEPGCTHK